MAKRSPGKKSAKKTARRSAVTADSKSKSATKVVKRRVTIEPSSTLADDLAAIRRRRFAS